MEKNVNTIIFESNSVKVNKISNLASNPIGNRFHIIKNNSFLKEIQVTETQKYIFYKKV